MFYHPDLFLQHSSNWFHLLSLINDQRWFLHFICVSSTVGCTHQTILLFSSLSLSVFLSLHVLLLAWSSAFLLFFMHVLVVWLDSARLLPLLLPSLSPPSIPLLLFLSVFFLFCSSSQSHSCFDSCAKLLLLSLLSQLQWDRNRWQSADPGWRHGGGASWGLLPHAGEQRSAPPGL